MSAQPPAICPACLTDRRAGEAARCPSCGQSIEDVIWEPFPGGARVWILRVLLAAIPGGLGVFMLVGAAHLWFGPRDPSLSPVLWVAFGIIGTAIGLAMIGVTNLLVLARRWDYRSPDGRTTGWVQTVLGRVFEAKGTHDQASAVPAPPADRLDSAVLAEPWCSVPLGLTMTVLGMAARGAVILHVVERRTLGRSPNWPLCLGWLGARTMPYSSVEDRLVEIAAAPGEREVRTLERALLSRLPLVEVVEAPSPHFREAAAVARAGAPVPLRDRLFGYVRIEGGAAALRELLARDEATTWITDESAAQRALAACREAAPGLVDLLEREAAMVAAFDERREAGKDAGGMESGTVRR